MLKGITLEVWFEGEELKTEEDGYLGEFGHEGKFQLHCSIERQKGKNPLCFTVDGKKNISPMENHSKNPSTSLYIKKIPVTRTDNIVFTTKPATNNIRLAIFDHEGKFEIWEIAVVSQDGFFFLTKQDVYASQWFRGENGEAVCPGFEKWPQLLEFLGPVMAEEELLPVSAYSPPPTIKANGLQKGQGRVLFWNLSSQMGIILLNKGIPARVYWRNLPPNMNGGLRKLETGQLVSYQKLIPIENSRTTVSLEAQRITLLS